jgi:hypothetical protein
MGLEELPYLGGGVEVLADFADDEIRQVLEPTWPSVTSSFETIERNRRALPAVGPGHRESATSVG